VCRSIKQLRRAERDVTDDEIQAAALQFVRKISGYRKPARSNVVPFEAAVNEVASATRRLLIEIGAIDSTD
jgi:hypothetical protein